MSERRGKRAASAPSSAWSPSTATGMTKAQFCSIICVFVTMTNWIDISKSLLDGTDSSYCNRHFKYATDSDNSAGSEESDIFKCTESDLGILAIKSHMTILRISLALLVALMCWNNEGMLRSWNYAYALCPLFSQLVVSQAIDICRNSLQNSELRSTLALLALSLSSNYEGRQGRMPMNIKEGMHNIILYMLTIFGSYLVASHLIEGAQGYTSFGDDVTAGGEAVWIMIMATDYAMIMFTVTFGLFFFDNARKKLLLFFLAVIFIVHALYHLPMEKDTWVDAPTRQNFAMGLFVSCMVGVLFPAFEDIEIKK